MLAVGTGALLVNAGLQLVKDGDAEAHGRVMGARPAMPPLAHSQIMSQDDRRDQPSTGHPAVVVDGDMDAVGRLRGSIRWALLVSCWFGIPQTIIPEKPGALSCPITTKPHAFFRWIQAWRTAGERRPLPGIQVRGAGSVLVINLAGTDNMTVPEAAFTGQQQAELSWNGNSWQTMT